VCDQETSETRRLKPATGLWKIQLQWVVTPGKNKQINKQTTDSFCRIFTHFGQQVWMETHTNQIIHYSFVCISLWDIIKTERKKSKNNEQSNKISLSMDRHS
jgi:hypothetical protein